MDKASIKNLTIGEESLVALIVDDLPVNRKIAKLLLEVKSITVIEAENGLQALDYYQEFNPDIILMDIHMPVMNGIDSMLKIREQGESSKEVPIIAFTSGDSTNTKNDLMDQGFSEYIKKPFKEQELIDILSLFLPLEEWGMRPTSRMEVNFTA